MKILEPRGEAEAPLWTTEGLSWEGLPYRGLKEKFNFDGTAAAPRKAQCYGRESHSRPTVSPVGKDNPRWAPSFPALWDAAWEAHLGLTPQRSLGEPAKPDPWQSEIEKGCGAYSDQCSHLGWLHSCLQWCLRRDPSQQLFPPVEPSCGHPGSAGSVGSSAWFGSPTNETHQPWSPLGRVANTLSCPAAQHGLESHTSGKHGDSCMAAVKHILWPTQAASEASSPAQRLSIASGHITRKPE